MGEGVGLGVGNGVSVGMGVGAGTLIVMQAAADSKRMTSVIANSRLSLISLNLPVPKKLATDILMLPRG